MNRGWETRGKSWRRLRLWLKPETWDQIDALAGEQAWHQQRTQFAVEQILEAWAARAKSRARLAQPSSIGPVELQPEVV